MQIKQLLNYFAEDTFVVIKTIMVEEGTKKFHILLSMPIKDIKELQDYYGSILDKNIGSGQVSIQNNTLYIEFFD